MSLEYSVVLQAISSAPATYLLGPELEIMSPDVNAAVPRGHVVRTATLSAEGKQPDFRHPAPDRAVTDPPTDPASDSASVTAQHLATIPGANFVTACSYQELVRALERRDRTVVVVLSDENLEAEPPPNATLVVPLTSNARDGRFTPADMLHLARRLADNPRLRELLTRLLKVPVQILLGFSPQDWLLAFLRAHLFEGRPPTQPLCVTFTDGRHGDAAWWLYEAQLISLPETSPSQAPAAFWSGATQHLVPILAHGSIASSSGSDVTPTRRSATLADAPCDVLYVEDNDDIRQTIRMILERFGYSVCEALNGEEGINLMRLRKPRLVLLDIMMPIIDGWNVLRICRVDPHLRALPIILLTAQSDAGEKATELGAVGYLTKPCHAREIVAEVRKFLGDPPGRAADIRQFTL